MFGERCMTTGGYHSPDPTMVKRKTAEMLGNQNHRIALVLIRTEGAGGHDLAFLETKPFAEIIEPPHEAGITKCLAFDEKFTEMDIYVRAGG